MNKVWFKHFINNNAYRFVYGEVSEDEDGSRHESIDWSVFEPGVLTELGRNLYKALAVDRLSYIADEKVNPETHTWNDTSNDCYVCKSENTCNHPHDQMFMEIDNNGGTIAMCLACGETTTELLPELVP